ncbi:SGNH/GDSL hydrolase family protein [Mucilaginibacter sp. BT774]|uniref:SGNH/GDSL hydrolase family protein n=1 Tax=Mucilaginibacter sp. BT774 TaxID=3062276 RepID=UPI0026766D75|nr:SGNH/GDSL hydrolase family protein [Mucilaginibacter sp. BT774]MDO3628812.1 SGNH/GDSL hydrolase family protein [Mucilaginibacter sp. BT774]
MRKLYFLFVLQFVAILGCAQNIVVKSHDTHIRYSGRIAMTDDAAELSWSASAIKMNFKGTFIKATLKDERGNDYWNVILDGKVISVLQPDSIQKQYTLATGLSGGSHTIELFKRSEWSMGKTWFYGFEMDKNAGILLRPAQQKRKMEFFGNSITCGYAIEDTTGQDRGTAPYENAYLSYASITARHFDAELHSTSRSGIGIMVSWAPLIMPEMYYRLDATDAESKWDFSKYTPDLVVINLFQNDNWIVKLPDNEQFKARFGTKAPTDDQCVKAYKDFVKTIRSKYPKAQIICALGSMDAVKEGAPWPGYIKKAVEQIGDKKIFVHIFPYKNTPGHPSKKEQQAMADDLIAFIDQNIKW